MSKEQTIIGKDRSYYRLQTDAELIEEAKYNPNPELCIALGERLDNKVRDGWDYECPRCGF